MQSIRDSVHQLLEDQIKRLGLSDDTYQRFVVNPPPGAEVVKTSWCDNPALYEELRLEIEHLKATDPDEYECVYEGMCRQAVTGSEFSRNAAKLFE